MWTLFRFYEEGLRFNSMDIIDLTSRTRRLFPDIPLSVTVPHILDMEEQVREGVMTSLGSSKVLSVSLIQDFVCTGGLQVALAQSLQELGVDVIQTEGSTSVGSRR